MTAPDPPASARRDAIDRFYRQHSAWLQRIIARRVSAPPHEIEDACQTTWMRLTRRPDITLDARGLRWLVTVATREVWALGRVSERPVGPFIGCSDDEPFELPEPAGPASDPLELALAHEQHAERVRAFATLKPRERRDLLLHAAGHSYAEIVELS